MEQKKTLWIIAAVGVFLIVCFGVAYLIINNPNENFEGTTTSISATENRNFDSGWTSPANFSEVTRDSEKTEEEINTDPNYQNANDVFVVANNATVVGLNTNEGTTIDLMTLGNNQVPNVTTNEIIKDNNKESEEVIKEPVQKNDALEYYAGNAKEDAKVEKQNSVKQYSDNSTKIKTTSNTNKVTNNKPAESTKKNSTASTNYAKTNQKNTASSTTVNSNKEVTRYWVQVSSYQNKKTAENARTILSDNKIPSDIFTYQDNSNNLFYRVRVGPYTTKSEAEYWMSKINQINNFKNAQSYVTSTTDK